MICPLCKGELALYCYPRTKVYIDREDNVLDSDQEEGYTWDESTEAECTECDWHGTVNETGSEEEDSRHRQSRREAVMRTLRRWLCRLGWHDWHYVQTIYHIRFWRCRRCGEDTTA